MRSQTNSVVEDLELGKEYGKLWVKAVQERAKRGELVEADPADFIITKNYTRNSNTNDTPGRTICWTILGYLGHEKDLILPTTFSWKNKEITRSGIRMRPLEVSKITNATAITLRRQFGEPKEYRSNEIIEIQEALDGTYSGKYGTGEFVLAVSSMSAALYQNGALLLSEPLNYDNTGLLMFGLENLADRTTWRARFILDEKTLKIDTIEFFDGETVLVELKRIGTGVAGIRTGLYESLDLSFVKDEYDDVNMLLIDSIEKNPGTTLGTFSVQGGRLFDYEDTTHRFNGITLNTFLNNFDTRNDFSNFIETGDFPAVGIDNVISGLEVGALKGNPEIETIVFGIKDDSVRRSTNAYGSALANCKNLRCIYFGSPNVVNPLSSKALAQAFSNCPKLQTVFLEDPKSTTTSFLNRSFNVEEIYSGDNTESWLINANGAAIEGKKEGFVTGSFSSTSIKKINFNYLSTLNPFAFYGNRYVEEFNIANPGRNKAGLVYDGNAVISTNASYTTQLPRPDLTGTTNVSIPGPCYVYHLSGSPEGTVDLAWGEIQSIANGAFVGTSRIYDLYVNYNQVNNSVGNPMENSFIENVIIYNNGSTVPTERKIFDFIKGAPLLKYFNLEGYVFEADTDRGFTNFKSFIDDATVNTLILPNRWGEKIKLDGFSALHRFFPVTSLREVEELTLRGSWVFEEEADRYINNAYHLKQLKLAEDWYGGIPKLKNCKQLEILDISEIEEILSLPNYPEIQFSQCPNMKVKVPFYLYDDYRDATNWLLLGDKLIRPTEGTVEFHENIELAGYQFAPESLQPLENGKIELGKEYTFDIWSYRGYNISEVVINDRDYIPVDEPTDHFTFSYTFSREVNTIAVKTAVNPDVPPELTIMQFSPEFATDRAFYTGSECLWARYPVSLTHYQHNRASNLFDNIGNGYPELRVYLSTRAVFRSPQNINRIILENSRLMEIDLKLNTPDYTWSFSDDFSKIFIESINENKSKSVDFEILSGNIYLTRAIVYFDGSQSPAGSTFAFIQNEGTGFIDATIQENGSNTRMELPTFIDKSKKHILYANLQSGFELKEASVSGTNLSIIENTIDIDAMPLIDKYAIYLKSGKEGNFERSKAVFDLVSKRTFMSTEKKVYEDNGLVFTNLKGTSTNTVYADTDANLRSYGIRTYNNSIIEINSPGNLITQLVFQNYNTNYVNYLKQSLTGLGEITVSGLYVTLTLPTPTENVSFRVTSSQVRIMSIEYEYTPNSGAPEVPEVPTGKIEYQYDQSNIKVVTLTNTGRNQEITDGTVILGEPHTLVIKAKQGYQINSVLVNGVTIVEGGPNIDSITKENIVFEKDTNEIVIDSSSAGDSPVTTEPLTITFDSTAKRIEFSPDRQVWTENGILVTHDKNTSTSAITDFFYPIRCYTSTSLVVTAGGNTMKTIVFECYNSSTYINSLVDSLQSSGINPSIDGNIITVSGIQSNAFAITFTGQTRLLSITVVCSDQEPVEPETPVVGSTITIQEALNIGATLTGNGSTDEKYYIEGEVIEIANPDKGFIWIKDDTAQIYVYGIQDFASKGIVVGSIVKLYAAVGVYNGTVELKSVELVEVHEKPQEPETPGRPADGSTLTLVAANNIGSSTGNNAYTTEKYYVNGTIEIIANTIYGNFYITDGSVDFYIYGSYDESNNRFDSMNPQPKVGDQIQAYGAIGNYQGAAQMKNAIIKITESAPEEVPEPEPSVPEGGKELVATFEFGENGAEEHKDGNQISSYSETSGSYTLTLNNLSKVYSPTIDAKGFSCLKLGTSSVVGGFSFVVDESIKNVEVYVAKYKAAGGKLTINGVTTAFNNSSNDGIYTAIQVDTSVNKEVTVTTEKSFTRCMINTIKFYTVAKEWAGNY